MEADERGQNVLFFFWSKLSRDQREKEESGWGCGDEGELVSLDSDGDSDASVDGLLALQVPAL